MTSHPPEHNWRPILTGSSAEPADEAIRAIAESLRQLPDDAIPSGTPVSYRDPANEPLLARGKAGQALFHAYFSEAFASVLAWCFTIGS